MTLAGRRVAVVLPAYNAERTLERTVRLVPPEVDDVVLVDDGSTDRTVELARDLGLVVVEHGRNVGYGANQKTCYRTALDRGAEVVVMLHPDGQYDPRLVVDLARPVARGEADLVLGSRMLVPGAARAGGMPAWKRAVNRALTAAENLALGARLSEAHTGYRAYSRAFLETVPWQRNADGFVFDTQVVFQAHAFGLRVVEVPVTARYEADSSTISFGASVGYGLRTLGVAASYVGFRLGVVRPGVFSRPRGG